jgi:curved DNA-binding protein CbpA
VPSRTILAVTYYDVLGVAPDASAAAIRRAYVGLARRYHPDFHTNASPGVRAANERAMQALNEAWAVLSDPSERRRYDDRYVRGSGDAATGGADARRARAEQDAQERAAWRPFDYDPDDDDDEDLDPRLLDDEPAAVVVSRRRQLVVVAPTLTFLGGVLLVVLGFVINLLPLSLLGLVAVVGAAVGFVVLPLLALSASARNDRR